MMRAASPPTHHPLPLPAPSASCRADIPEADIPHQKRLLVTAPTPRFEVGESLDVVARQPGSTMARRVDYSFRDHAALHDEVDTLRMYLSSLCTTHKQEKTQAYRYEWQCQDANDHATRAIMRIHALEAGARVDTLEDTGSFPPLSMQVTITAGNAPGDSICAISECFTNTAYGFFLGKKVTYLVVANYVRNTSNNPLILKKWHPDENLLKEDVSTIPVWVKLHDVPVMAFSEDGLSAIATNLGTPLMQSWGRSSYARVMIELRADVELKDNIVVAMPKITREGHYTCVVEKKTVKKHSQTSRGVLVGPKMWKCMEPTIEVSNSNPFDALISVDNDVEFGTNGGTTIGNPLVPLGIVESDSEMEVVFDETAYLWISTSGKDGSDKGYGTNSLLEQWRDSYPDNDDYDPYDDDMYENLVV
ncbi:beta-caryophyllene synthase [Tanacetum coccineum]|uniref:Beta-caryophyllene synthase n=1 Tax=Tanacetum coccineum TaxID=301880 RepID=A0ABQ5IF63_9ASTR